MPVTCRIGPEGSPAGPRPWPGPGEVRDPAASAIAALAARASARCLAPGDDGDADMVARVARHAAECALVRALRRGAAEGGPGSLSAGLRWRARVRERALERLPALLAAAGRPPAPLAGYPVDLPRAARLRAAYGAARALGCALANIAIDGRRALLLGEAPPAGIDADGRPRRAWTGPSARRIERLAAIEVPRPGDAFDGIAERARFAMPLRSWCAPDNVAREACDLGALPAPVAAALAAAALSPENVRGRAVVLAGRAVAKAAGGLGLGGEYPAAEGRWFEVADALGRSTAWCMIAHPSGRSTAWNDLAAWEAGGGAAGACPAAEAAAGVLRPLAEAALIGATWRQAGSADGGPVYLDHDGQEDREVREE